MQHDPSSAAVIAAALGARAEAVCRQYLPHGRRQGRYWVAGDIDGARGALALRPPCRPRHSRQVDRCSPGNPRRLARPDPAIARAHRRCARRSTRRAPSSPCRLPRTAIRGLCPFRAPTIPMTRRRRPAACGGAAAPSPAAMPSAICTFAACRAAASRRCASIPSFAIATARPCAGTRRWSPPSPVTTAGCSAWQRTWLDPRRPAKAGIAVPRKALGRIHGLAVRFGAPADGLASLVVGEGIETVLSLVTAVPEIRAAAALSAGSLGAFAPPPGAARLVIARDNDEDGALAAERLVCAARGSASPPTSSSPSATISTTTWSTSARRRSAPASRRCSAAREGESSGGRASRPKEWRETMNAVINLRHEPRLREKFEYAHVVQQHRADRPPHEVGERVPHRSRAGSRAGDRALPCGSVAPHPRGRDRAARSRRTGRMLAGVLVRRKPPLSCRGARACGGLGIGQAVRAGGCVMRSVGLRCLQRSVLAMPSARAIRSNHGSQASRNFLSYPYRLRAQGRAAHFVCQEGSAGQRIVSEALQAGTAERGPCGWRDIRPAVMFHCATRAHCANPASGGVLHSAALRSGRDSQGIRRWRA